MKRLLLSLFAFFALSLAADAQTAKTKTKGQASPNPTAAPKALTAAEQKKKDEKKVLDYQNELKKKNKIAQLEVPQTISN